MTEKTRANVPLSTPLTQIQKEEKINQLEKAMRHILGDIMQIDLENDPNSKNTPKRVAKSWINERFAGRFDPMPEITEFDNTLKYSGLISVGPIKLTSFCSHHLADFFGYVFIHIVPGENSKVAGLSKYARVVKKIAATGQIQEELTNQIKSFFEEKLNPVGIYVSITATHTCMCFRGVQDPFSVTTTASMNDFVRGNSDLRNEIAHNEEKALKNFNF